MPFAKEVKHMHRLMPQGRSDPPPRRRLPIGQENISSISPAEEQSEAEPPAPESKEAADVQKKGEASKA